MLQTQEMQARIAEITDDLRVMRLFTMLVLLPGA